MVHLSPGSSLLAEFNELLRDLPAPESGTAALARPNRRVWIFTLAASLLGLAVLGMLTFAGWHRYYPLTRHTATDQITEVDANLVAERIICAESNGNPKA